MSLKHIIIVFCLFIVISCISPGLPGPTIMPVPGTEAVGFTLPYGGNIETAEGYPVEGHWTRKNSPYLVTDNIIVEKGSSLVIDPGVKVIFQGPYWLRIRGSVKAAGTAEMPIVFTATDEDIAKGDNWSGWLGIRICGDDYDPDAIDHGPGIYDFRFCEIAYVDKSAEPEGHPWERLLCNFYSHGASETDLIFNDNYLHHGRSGLFAFYGASQSVIEDNPVFYRNVFEHCSGYAVLQVAHVYRKDTTSSAPPEEHYMTVRFVDGSVSHFEGVPNPNITVVDTWDSPVIVDQVVIDDCGDQDNWFYSWITPESGKGYASVTYIEPD